MWVAEVVLLLGVWEFFGFVFLFPSDAGLEASAAAEGYPSGPISNPKHCNYYYYIITFVVRKCVFLNRITQAIEHFLI